MSRCHNCRNTIKMARWQDVIMEIRTGKIAKVSFFVPYEEATDTFNLDIIFERYPIDEYYIYSFSPDKFKAYAQTGAFCTKCNADL